VNTQAGSEREGKSVESKTERASNRVKSETDKGKIHPLGQSQHSSPPSPNRSCTHLSQKGGEQAMPTTDFADEDEESCTGILRLSGSSPCPLPTFVECSRPRDSEDDEGDGFDNKCMAVAFCCSWRVKKMRR
jgi:hypothetical protein